MPDPQHILIIEDDENDQFIAQHIINKTWSSCRLSFASDGIEAIELLDGMQGEHPDLIMLDINMPRMDGHEFLENWFQDKSMEIPVVVMLTSSAQESDQERAGAFHCVKDYLIKPPSIETLTSMKWR